MDAPLTNGSGRKLVARRSTITDVAKLAGVSIKTVSRVVRCEPNVREETRKTVEAAVAELNYRPTVSARSSTSARSYTIGLILDNPQSAYAFELLRGAHGAARANGYHLLIEPIGPEIANVASYVSDLVVQSNLDGLVLPPPLGDDRALLAELDKLGCVAARIAPGDTSAKSIDIAIDDKAAAMAVTQHLIRLGHTQIGFVKGTEGAVASSRRLQGFKAAMASEGLEVREDWILEGNFDLRSGFDAGEALLHGETRPSAIFASNDAMAAGVLIAAYRLGLAAPKDISVAGFDDSVMATAMWPALTTVRQPVFAMAEIATTRLIAHLRQPGGESLDPQNLEFELIVRDSTGPVPAGR